jgi:S-adenosyl-L-methionine hydrolase (adenosine-forming)
MPNRLITLTTDFGTADHFVGVLKGVIAQIAPTARVVDISHEVQPFEVAEGAFTIAQAYRYFPKRTVHVVVVDPGVGSTRRPILAEAGGHYFVAPDNGVLSMVLAREVRAKVRHITNDKYFLHPVSRTFHGRDVFSPVGAHLAKGVLPARFGKLIEDHLRLNFEKPSRTGKRSWTGQILKVDRFGNLITNFHVDDFPDIRTRAFGMNVGLRTVGRLALTFTECDPGELFVVVGSSGYLEVATNQGSAAKMLGCGAGSPAELVFF